MPRYLNPSRSPVVLTLPGNRSVSVLGRQQITLSPEDAGTASVVRAVAKGLLRALPELGAPVVPAPVAPQEPSMLRFPGEVYVDPAPASVSADHVVQGDSPPRVPRTRTRGQANG